MSSCVSVLRRKRSECHPEFIEGSQRFLDKLGMTKFMLGMTNSRFGMTLLFALCRFAFLKRLVPPRIFGTEQEGKGVKESRGKGVTPPIGGGKTTGRNGTRSRCPRGRASRPSRVKTNRHRTCGPNGRPGEKPARLNRRHNR